MKKILLVLLVVFTTGCVSTPTTKKPSNRDKAISSFNYSNELAKSKYRICNLSNFTVRDIYNCRVRAINEVLASCAFPTLCDLFKQKRTLFKKIAFNAEDFENNKISKERYTFNHNTYDDELRAISQDYDLMFTEAMKILKIQEYKAEVRSDIATERLIRSIGSVLLGQDVN